MMANSFGPWIAFLACSCSIALSSPAGAQPYPTKPVKLFVGQPLSDWCAAAAAMRGPAFQASHNPVAQRLRKTHRTRDDRMLGSRHGAQSKRARHAPPTQQGPPVSLRRLQKGLTTGGFDAFGLGFMQIISDIFENLQHISQAKNV